MVLPVDGDLGDFREPTAVKVHKKVSGVWFRNNSIEPWPRQLLCVRDGDGNSRQTGCNLSIALDNLLWRRVAGNWSSRLSAVKQRLHDTYSPSTHSGRGEGGLRPEAPVRGDVVLRHVYAEIARWTFGIFGTTAWKNGAVAHVLLHVLLRKKEAHFVLKSNDKTRKKSVSLKNHKLRCTSKTHLKI